MSATNVAASGLDHLIPPEIRRDRFARWLRRIAATPGVDTILEIGSSSGEGSTSALVAGALHNPRRPTIHCVEISKPRFAALVARYRGFDFVRCHNVSSVSLDRFPSESDVERFHRTIHAKLRRPSLQTMLAWLRQDLEYVARHGLSQNGIRRLKSDLGIERFDAVLIDGSEFTGSAELQDVFGARYLMLDDILTFKNYDNLHRLREDPAYRLLAHSRWRRNGYAIFVREGAD